MASAKCIMASALLLASAVTASAQPATCDRRCLEGIVERYLDALVKHDPSAVPLAATARYTENGQRLTIGDGLWHSVRSKSKYRLENGMQTTNRPTPAGESLAELFKIENGLIHRVEATLERVPYGMTSGWSSWEDGMSDRARDVTH